MRIRPSWVAVGTAFPQVEDSPESPDSPNTSAVASAQSPYDSPDED